MNLTCVRSDKLQEEYYTAVHKSGLKIILFPKKGAASSYAIFGTKCGSIDCNFRLEGEGDFTLVPEGIAHFLEHKLFESEEGDAFTRYAATGASANAYTSFDKTCYLFSCTENFYPSLDILLDFVQDPYFTEETVQKEQGIIGQEIKMYEDDPEWRVFFNLLRALYRENPIRVDIAGTVESISNITAELLYRCYHAFYNPANMALCVCGDFDVKEVASFIDSRIQDVQPKKISSKPFDEPPEAQQKRVEQKLSVSLPMFRFGYKDAAVPEGVEGVRRMLAVELLLDILFGSASPFYCRLYDEGLINSSFGAEYLFGRGFGASLIGGESREPDRVVERIKECVAQALTAGIEPDRLERARRKMYGELIGSFDSVEGIANNAIAYAFLGENTDVFTVIEELEKMTKEQIDTVLRDHFKEEASAVSVILPQ